MEKGKATADDKKETGKQYNPVQKQKIFEEMVHKEVAYQRTQAQREYTLNPFTMPVISEKPNQVTPSEPFKAKNKTSDAPGTDDVVDRAFRLETMRR